MKLNSDRIRQTRFVPQPRQRLSRPFSKLTIQSRVYPSFSGGFSAAGFSCLLRCGWRGIRPLDRPLQVLGLPPRTPLSFPAKSQARLGVGYDEYVTWRSQARAKSWVISWILFSMGSRMRSCHRIHKTGYCPAFCVELLIKSQPRC